MAYNLRMYFSPHQTNEDVGEIEIDSDTAEELFESGRKIVLSPYTDRRTGEVLGFMVDQLKL